MPPNTGATCRKTADDLEPRPGTCVRTQAETGSAVARCRAQRAGLRAASVGQEARGHNTGASDGAQGTDGAHGRAAAMGERGPTGTHRGGAPSRNRGERRPALSGSPSPAVGTDPRLGLGHAGLRVTGNETLNCSPVLRKARHTETSKLHVWPPTGQPQESGSHRDCRHRPRADSPTGRARMLTATGTSPPVRATPKVPETLTGPSRVLCTLWHCRGLRVVPTRRPDASLTLGVRLGAFRVTTIENSSGKRSHLTKILDAGKLMAWRAAAESWRPSAP